MSYIKVGDNESLESALKRFKRKCQKIMCSAIFDVKNFMKNRP